MTGFKDRLLAPYNGLKVSWFDSWHPLLDEALQNLPEMESCPHELFRILIQNPGPVRKRIALVTELGTPSAVVGLRQKGRYSWEPITQWIIPGALFPAKTGYLIPALEALGAEVDVAWWRMENPPPLSSLARNLESTPTYRLHRSEDFEQYWRKNGYFKTIRRIRNRCLGLTPVINSPGSSKWTIKNWDAKWRLNSRITSPSLLDRVVAAEYLENHGRHHTIMLLDGETPVGGATMSVQQKDLVAGVLYYEPNYRQSGIGDRLIDLSFSFAAECGYETIDIGGGHEYKRNWAKQEGERWWFTICPEPLFRIKQLAHWARQRGVRNNRGERPQLPIG